VTKRLAGIVGSVVILALVVLWLVGWIYGQQPYERYKSEAKAGHAVGLLTKGQAKMTADALCGDSDQRFAYLNQAKASASTSDYNTLTRHFLWIVDSYCHAKADIAHASIDALFLTSP